MLVVQAAETEVAFKTGCGNMMGDKHIPKAFCTTFRRPVERWWKNFKLKYPEQEWLMAKVFSFDEVDLGLVGFADDLKYKSVHEGWWRLSLLRGCQGPGLIEHP